VPITVVVEDGTGSNAAANSLASVAAIDAIAETTGSMPNWTAEGATETDDKKKAVIHASRLFKRWVNWDGGAAVQGQPLPWPRVNCVDENGFPIPADEVASCVVEALAVTAEALLADWTREDDPETGLKSLQADKVQLNFDAYDRQGVIPRGARAALRSVASFPGSIGKARR
jgi:hypothetical protein